MTKYVLMITVQIEVMDANLDVLAVVICNIISIFARILNGFVNLYSKLKDMQVVIA